jgi:prepilin-type processing-associated H-X9-DG protein
MPSGSFLFLAVFLEPISLSVSREVIVYLGPYGVSSTSPAFWPTLFLVFAVLVGISAGIFTAVLFAAKAIGSRITRKMPAAFACPLNEERKGWAEMSTYQVIVGPQTMFTGGTAGVRHDEVTDGTSHTILVVETNDLAPWTAPHDVAFSSASSLGTCGSGHPGGLNAAMADGSVHFIKPTIDPDVLWSLMTRNGGEVNKPEQY